MAENQTTPTGQIAAPNPIELFWEKNRRWVLLVVGALAVVLAVKYGYEYFRNRKVDTSWSLFADVTNLRSGYAEDGSLGAFLNDPQMAQMGGASWLVSRYLQQTRSELVTELPDDLLKLPIDRLSQQITAAQGTAMEPLLLWVSALYSAEKDAWDGALKALGDLESRFPQHFLCISTPYPPQYRPPEKIAEEAAAETHGKKETKLRPAVAGSLVSRLRDELTRERDFRAAQSRLYTPPEPDASPEVVIRFSPIEEEIRIQLYSSKAPRHVENLLRLAREGDFYTGQRVDEVQREPSKSPSFYGQIPVQMHLGLPVTKETEDRTKWTAAKSSPSGTVLDFEVNDLSHFAGMVAAEPEGDGKSSGERIWILASDAPQLDGERVIFGRVVPEDLEKVRRICAMAFSDVEMDRAGRGQLQQNVTVASIRVVGE